MKTDGKPWSWKGLGAAARMMLCLAAVLIFFEGTASAQLVYAVEFNQSQNLFGTINLDTGSFTPLGNEGSTLFNDIAAMPDGTLYGIVNSSSLVTLNTTDGSEESSVGFSVGGIESLAVAPNGTLYGASQSALYTIDPATGIATLVGNFNNSALSGSGQNIRFSNGVLYDTDGGVNAQNTDLFQISLANGYASQVGTIADFPGLCLENSGQIMYGAGIQLGAASTVNQDLVGINLSSAQPGSSADLGYALLTGDFPINYNFSAPGDYSVPGMPLQTTPEPGVVSSFVIGGGLLLGLKRRLRR